ncbi:MAG: transposase, partial [Bacteroides cellulosilyticus]|nr:transposase [Bacteroides cellulosilyticus]
MNKLTLQKSKIKMKYSKKKYNYYSDDERMS